MTYNLIRIVRKLDFDENILDVYASLCDGLADLEAPWGVKGVDVKLLKDEPDWPENGVSYRLRGDAKRLGIGFCNRRRSRDAGDLHYLEDHIHVEFNAARREANLKYVFNEVIPVYIRAFDAFYASVEDLDVRVRDDEKFWSLSPQEREIFIASDRSRRNTCSYIWQVNFWAREQCSKYFGLSPEEVVERLSGHVARVDMLLDGAYFVVSYEPMSSEAMEKITPTLMPLLERRQ